MIDLTVASAFAPASLILPVERDVWPKSLMVGETLSFSVERLFFWSRFSQGVSKQTRKTPLSRQTPLIRYSGFPRALPEFFVVDAHAGEQLELA